jgi:hypothetical protein
MHTVVRLDPRCTFDIGERTPDVRALVKQYVKAFMDFAGEHAGRLPGARLVEMEPPTFAWTDANWVIGYIVEESRGKITITISEIRLRSDGGNR